jgi:hypothetical protein
MLQIWQYCGTSHERVVSKFVFRGIRPNIQSKENDQTNIFERIISKILPKNCHYLAKFRPMQNLMPTISKKWYQWLNNYVTIQSLSFNFKMDPKETLRNIKTANFTISEKILKSPMKKQQIHKFEMRKLV